MQRLTTQGATAERLVMDGLGFLSTVAATVAADAPQCHVCTGSAYQYKCCRQIWALSIRQGLTTFAN